MKTPEKMKERAKTQQFLGDSGTELHSSADYQKEEFHFRQTAAKRREKRGDKRKNAKICEFPGKTEKNPTNYEKKNLPEIHMKFLKIPIHQKKREKHQLSLSPYH